MTTQNLKGIDALAKANKVVADSARARGKELEKEAADAQRQHDTDLEDAEIARRALEQSHRDRMAVVDEEAGQLAYVLAGVRPSAESDTSQQPPASAEPAVAAPTAPPVVPPPAQPPVAQTDIQLPARQPRTVTVNVWNPRDWSVLQWIMAFIGLIIGMLIARLTYHPVWDDITGVGHNVAVFFWFVAIMGACFFAGGLLGSRLGRKSAAVTTVQETER